MRERYVYVGVRKDVRGWKGGVEGGRDGMEKWREGGERIIKSDSRI